MTKNNLLLSGLFLFISFGFATKTIENEPLTKAAFQTYFYQADVLYNLLKAPSCDGIRFYSASGQDGSRTIVAISVSNGRDIPNVNYLLYQGPGINSSIIKPVNRNTAKNACSKTPIGQRFAVTFKKHQIERMLQIPQATGIVFSITNNSGGYTTLNAMPALLKEGVINHVSSIDGLTVDDPCPSACGENSNSNYLVQMME